MKIHYLKIVASAPDAVRTTYEAAHGVQFGAPDIALGGARTASLPDGSLVGLRGTLHETEAPVVRSYWLVDDIETALASAVAEGTEVAHPPLALPGKGTFAIYVQGAVHHGLWQR